MSSEERHGRDRPDRERRLKRDLADSAAAAVRTGQRVVEFLEESGVRPDMLEGTGDAIYEVVLQQLQVTNRMLQSGFRLADTLLRKSRPRPRDDEDEDDTQVVAHGAHAKWSARIHNHRSDAGDISFSLHLHRHGEHVQHEDVDWKCARRCLDPGRSTLVRLEIGTKDLEPDAYVATIFIYLTFANGKRQVRREEIELHVVPKRRRPSRGG